MWATHLWLCSVRNIPNVGVGAESNGNLSDGTDSASLVRTDCGIRLNPPESDT